MYNKILCYIMAMIMGSSAESETRAQISSCQEWKECDGQTTNNPEND